MDRVLLRIPSMQVKIDILQGQALRRRPNRFAKASFVLPDTMTLDVDDADRNRLIALGAVVYDDVQFEVLPGPQDDEEDVRYWAGLPPDEDVQGFSLADVVEQVRAPQAWRHTRGENVTIAVIDTGVAGALKEIPVSRRSTVDLRSRFVGAHWTDKIGHGSMCAAIAGGSKQGGGRYDGVAPGATILAARSSLRSTDIFDIYDELVRERVEGGIQTPLVVTNSYGMYVCSSPRVMPEDHPFMSSILAAIDTGIFVCFAAGNNHVDQCAHDPRACGPNSIWGPNSHDRVMSVGTVNRGMTNRDPSTDHVNSSRGPGEWAKQFLKPDCVAPTYGEVPWGTGYAKMGWWGTSGACPQIAGLAALILSIAPALQPATVAGIIRETCSLLPGDKSCVGHGVINCEDAVKRATQLASTS